MENQVNTDIIQNLKNTAFWRRLLFMVIFGIAYTIAEFAVWAAILFLIFFNLFTGGSNERAVIFGKQMSTYIYHILLYLTYNSEERPFPFSDWPSPEGAPLSQPPSTRPATATASPQPATHPEPTTTAATADLGVKTAKENSVPESNETPKTE